MNIATDINECEGVVCQNGGTCEDLVNDFNCACVAGYSGENCETSEWLALAGGVFAARRARSFAYLTPLPLAGPVRCACRHQRMRGRRVPERRRLRGRRECVQLRLRGHGLQRGELRNE